jgi:hypothetical protein
MSSVEARQEDRDSVFLMTELAFAGRAGATRLKIRNLSARGMMVEGEVCVRSGEKIAAILRNIGPVVGTVIWVRTPRFGVAFEECVDPKRARRQVTGSDREAPIYARAALSAPRHDGWNGKLRRI